MIYEGPYKAQEGSSDMRQRSFKGSDYKATGLPDISFHGKKRHGKVDHENYRRQLGVLLQWGVMPKGAEGVPDDSSFYVGVNIHWEPQVPIFRS